MARQRSLRNKALHFISQLTTVILNPISDHKPSKPSQVEEEEEDEAEAEAVSERSEEESFSEEGSDSESSMEGPDTSSFTAFLYSLLKDDYFTAESEDENHDDDDEVEPAVSTVEPEPEIVNVVKEGGGGKKGLFYRGKQSIGKVINFAARLAGFRNQALEKKNDPEENTENDEHECQDDGGESRVEESVSEQLALANLPDMSEPSLLLSQKTRMKLYASLPPLVKGRKWVLLYSTWRHGISLSTLYRRSMLCPGLTLLVVGDRGGAVFGGLVEAPLKPSTNRKYQGTSSTFVFSDIPGKPVVYPPTGANHYYVLCSPDFLAFGGGPHFALYLDSDLLNGSSGASETYGNPCLACSENFAVKEVELWSFVHASRYEEMLISSQNEAPGISRW